MPASQHRRVGRSTRSALLLMLVATAVATSPSLVSAQERDADDRRERREARERVRHGIAIGDQRYVDGIRINFRDFDMERVRGINITAWWPHGSARGTNVSALNYVRGRQSGLALGIVNYARTMRSGMQVGLVNIISENPPARRVLPIVNYGAR